MELYVLALLATDMSCNAVLCHLLSLLVINKILISADHETNCH